jgi:hypothetical protein
MTGSFFRLAPSSRRTKKIVIVLAALYAVYALAAALLGPVLVRRILPQRMAAQLHRPVTVGRVRVNPVTIAVTVDSLRVADRDGSTLLSLDVAYVNASLMSVLRRELDFDEIRFEQPYAHFVMRHDGTMNVSDIIDSMNAEAKAHPSPGPPPVFAVSGLHILNAKVEVVDSQQAKPFSTVIGPWRVDLASFSTRRDNTGQYSFSGTMVTGETFAWLGTFAMDPVRSTGQFAVDGVRLGTYGAYYQRNFRFDPVAGKWGMKAEYSVDLTPNARVLRLQAGEAHATDVALVERGHADTAVTFARLEVNGIEADAVKNVAKVSTVTVSGAQVNANRSRDSTINVVRMWFPPDDTAGGAAASKGPPPKPWKWTIVHVAADSADMTVLDSVAVRPAKFTMSGIAATMDSVASDSAQLSRVQASLLWEKRGPITANGTVAIWHRSGDIAYTAKDVSLQPFDAYFLPMANLLITDGTAVSDGKVHFEWADTLHPELRYTGNVRVDRFATVDGTRKEPFLKYRAFRMANIDYAMRQPRLAIKSIEIDEPVVYVGVLPDGTPAMKSVFPRPGEDSALAAADSAAARAARDSAARDSTHHDSASAAPPAPAPPPPAPLPAPAAKKAKGGKTAPAAPPMRTSIGYVKVNNGSIILTDRSMKPPVAFSIDKIQAITGKLSSESLGVGTLEVTAAIDSIAPLKVAGRFNPLSSKEGSDLTIEMQGMEMVPIGPYFGKYLGYGISTGKLKVGMQYRVVARRLKSENKITLDGFEWGDASNSPDATKLPVKLAFSIMRDRDGQILFDVPIEGNLDDPSFRYGRVIVRAIVNVLTKLATSPFKLLGAAFGGGNNADLSFAEFQPGSSKLDPAVTSKLDVLAKALYQRPALKLQIAGSIDTAADLAGLKRARLDARLRIVKWNALKAQGANPGPADSLLLADANRPLWLAKEFETTFPSDTAVIRTKGKQGALPYPADVMEQKLMATIQVGPDEIQPLAAARAKACLDYLLTVPTNKIEPERVLLLGGAPKTAGAKAVFTLQ